MSAKIFVGNLYPQTTQLELVQFLSAAGRVANISIPVDQETGQSRGFCFVESIDRESAEKALSICDGGELDGRQLQLSWARGRGSGSGGGGRADRRRDGEGSLEEEEGAGPKRGGPRRGSSGSADYVERRRPRGRRHGKHGSDRKRRHGTQREIE